MADSVVVVGAVRTAIGKFGGSLAGHAPSALGGLVAAEALKRAGMDPAGLGHIVFGNVIPTGPQDAYLARVAAVEAGIPVEVPAMTLNRLCGSGVQAIISAAQAIMLGDCDAALAGGAEVMSRAPHYLTVARFGQRIGDATALDGLTGILTDPFGNGIMGITAENVAAKYGISREDQDAFAAESQRRTAAAASAGHFTDQILPIEVAKGRAQISFQADEYPKPETSPETLAALPAAFRKGGTVTAGNASGINDGAAAVVLASERHARSNGLEPIARIVGYAHAGCEPGLMGCGPIPAVRALLARTSMSIGDFDVIESNEAFASQALAVSRELEMNPALTNPDGGAIALGHPVGATGAILTVKAISYLKRTGGRFGLITMCIGGGQGIALALERM
ncbi:beta-ketothiolase BktB [Bosea sp. (in: a-proteobacteria)]|uniref:beta-ketothiolase BktB n=1 Tax=Bosea sp. (in: a-proteobacteria) TaxID=1871050 RepID=UPI003B3A7E25